jgi:hydroxymethylpyrimidine kinase/phosphomethylpyrimidine kinase
MQVYKALTIAGSDSGGGAGIQADLKTFAALGVYGCSVITAVTAQNTRQVTGIHDLPPEMVQRQIEAVLTDIRPHAVKIGMLSNSSIVQAVAESLRGHPSVPLVLDPVMVSKSGDALLAGEATRAVREKLLPLATLLTPNIPEAEVLVGGILQTEEDFVNACKSLRAMGSRIVVLKGGHRPLTGKDALEVVDLYFDGEEIRKIRGPFVNTPHTHGTGCTFASAITAGLAKGFDPYTAVLQAREYLTGALQMAFPVGEGKSPVHHFFRWWLP